jgi:hypothetical protein
MIHIVIAILCERKCWHRSCEPIAVETPVVVLVVREVRVSRSLHYSYSSHHTHPRLLSSDCACAWCAWEVCTYNLVIFDSLASEEGIVPSKLRLLRALWRGRGGGWRAEAKRERGVSE